MKRLQTSTLVMMLVIANAAAACQLYRSLMPQRERLACMLMDFRDDPATAADRLIRAMLD